MMQIQAMLAAAESSSDKAGFLHNLPLDDWQFWITSAIVVGAVLWIARSTILPIFTARRKRRSKVTLTMNGDPVKK